MQRASLPAAGTPRSARKHPPFNEGLSSFKMQRLGCTLTSWAPPRYCTHRALCSAALQHRARAHCVPVEPVCPAACAQKLHFKLRQLKRAQESFQDCNQGIGLGRWERENPEYHCSTNFLEENHQELLSRRNVRFWLQFGSGDISPVLCS